MRQGGLNKRASTCAGLFPLADRARETHYPINSDMRLLLVVLAVTIAECAAQPVTNSTTLATLDVDGNGNPEAYYSVSSKLRNEFPETWDVITSFGPNGQSRILKASDSRVEFSFGERISPSSIVHTITNLDFPRPPSFFYGLGLISYRADYLGDWLYTSEPFSRFEAFQEFLIGFKFAFADGGHLGWLKLSRSVVDNHTIFDLKEVAFHPLPGEPILAGEPPPLPSISMQTSNDLLEFRWDPRWGPLVFETSTIMETGTWQTLVVSSGGPVSAPANEQARFYRLRKP